MNSFKKSGALICVYMYLYYTQKYTLLNATPNHNQQAKRVKVKAAKAKKAAAT